MKHLDKFMDFIIDRYDIKELRRRYVPKPWTSDKILQTYHFCNVHQADDRTTKWILKRMGGWQSYEMAPEINLLIARFVNNPKSLRAMEWPFNRWDEAARLKFLLVMGRDGAWGSSHSAYVIRKVATTARKNHYVDNVITGVAPIGEASDTLQEAYKALVKSEGITPFLADLVVSDLKRLPGHPLEKALDWWSFCYPDIRCRRGMAEVYDMDSITVKGFFRGLITLRLKLEQQLEGGIPPLCAHDIQQCLRSYLDYEEIKAGILKKKRKYACSLICP